MSAAFFHSMRIAVGPSWRTRSSGSNWNRPSAPVRVIGTMYQPRSGWPA